MVDWRFSWKLCLEDTVCLIVYTLQNSLCQASPPILIPGCIRNLSEWTECLPSLMAIEDRTYSQIRVYTQLGTDGHPGWLCALLRKERVNRAHTNENPGFPSALSEQGCTVSKPSGVRLLSYSLCLPYSLGPGHSYSSFFYFLAVMKGMMYCLPWTPK